MPSTQQETRNKWVTMNFFDKLKQVLKPVMNVEPFESSDFVRPPKKPDGYKSSQSSSARII